MVLSAYVSVLCCAAQLCLPCRVVLDSHRCAALLVRISEELVSPRTREARLRTAAKHVRFSLRQSWWKAASLHDLRDPGADAIPPKSGVETAFKYAKRCDRPRSIGVATQSQTGTRGGAYLQPLHEALPTGMVHGGSPLNGSNLFRFARGPNLFLTEPAFDTRVRAPLPACFYA